MKSTRSNKALGTMSVYKGAAYLFIFFTMFLIGCKDSLQPKDILDTESYSDSLPITEDISSYDTLTKKAKPADELVGKFFYFTEDGKRYTNNDPIFINIDLLEHNIIYVQDVVTKSSKTMQVLDFDYEYPKVYIEASYNPVLKLTNSADDVERYYITAYLKGINIQSMSFNNRVFSIKPDINPADYDLAETLVTKEVPRTYTKKKIAPPKTYRVQPGDKLDDICTKYGVNVISVMKLNPELRGNPNLILVGEVLTLRQ